MKKLTCVLLCGVTAIMLVSCGNDKSPTSTVPLITNTSKPTLSSSEISPTAIPSATPTPITGLGLTMEDLKAALDNTDLYFNPNFVTTGNFTFWQFNSKNGFFYLMAFTDNESQEVTSVQIMLDSSSYNQSNKKYIKLTVDSIVNSLTQDCKNTLISDEKTSNEKTRIQLYTPSQSTFIQSLSDNKYDYRNPNDIVGTKEREEEFFKYMKNYNLAELYAFSVDLVNKNGLTDSIAQQVSNLIEPILPYLDSITVNTDSVEDKIILTYVGAEKLSQDTHLISIIDGGTQKTTIGFYASDWLFFDSVVIKINEDCSYTSAFDSNEVSRETSNDGTVFESVSLGTVTDTMLEKLEQVPSDPVIRFKTKDSQNHLDFPLSQAEIDSVVILNKLKETRTAIRNLI